MIKMICGLSCNIQSIYDIPSRKNAMNETCQTHVVIDLSSRGYDMKFYNL